MPKSPGFFDTFKGLWARGDLDSVPSDHFSDCRNNCFNQAGVTNRDSTTQYSSRKKVVRKALYKPNPPFAGNNVPRMIVLDSDGNLIDELINTVIHSDSDWKDFALVNFFGRCYITPSDGKTGLNGESVYVYDGSGSAIRVAGGTTPVTALSLTTPANVAGGHLAVGQYLISYSFETSTGFITQPAPFVGFEALGGFKLQITNLPTGPAGTAARWIIVTQSNEIGALGPLGGPFDTGKATILPLFFYVRIGDNATTTATVDFYDEGLQEDASYLLALLTTIPAGVGLIDYKGRMVSYGEYSNPSLVRVSEIGEPEQFSATSGFIITDPADSTGVRSATEFRDNLFFFKRTRGATTQDNQDTPSSWQVVNFEKAVGTESYGIAQILDAKGSSSDGFILAALDGLHYFNGVFVEPELSYKIKDLWGRINQNYFHKIQVVNDPIARRIYVLAPLDNATAVSHILFGDYRDGLTANLIKWSPWDDFNGEAPTNLLVYTDFTNDIPKQVTRISTLKEILTLNVDEIAGNVDSSFSSAIFRFTDGISQYNKVTLRGSGPAIIKATLVGMDDGGPDGDNYFALSPIEIPVAKSGREFFERGNLISEQCILKIDCSGPYKIHMTRIIGSPYMDERPQ